MKLRFLLLAALLLFFTSCVSNGKLGKTSETCKSSDGLFTVHSDENGFIFSRTKDSKKLTSVEFHVERSDGNENFYVQALDKDKKVEYLFVEKGSDYKVWMTYRDQNNKTKKSEKVQISAYGGMGDCWFQVYSYDYDNDTQTIQLNSYVLDKPAAAPVFGEIYTGSIYYNLDENGTAQSYFWTRLNSADDKIFLNLRNDKILNQKFYVSIAYRLYYKKKVFASTVIYNKDNPFEDIHPLENLTVSRGVLSPVFNPTVMNYTITGTTEPVYLYPEVTKDAAYDQKFYYLANVEGSTQKITVSSGGKTFDYTFTWVESECVNFEGQDYILSFYDDFEGDSLDRTKWNWEPDQWRQENMRNWGFWYRDCAYVKDGNLVIESKKLKGQYVAGGVTTEGIFEQNYGLYEIKFKMNYSAGLWDAFWLMGHNDVDHIGNGAVDGAEIDVFELIHNLNNKNKGRFASTIHWDAYQKYHKNATTDSAKITEDFYNQWHVLKFVWNVDSYSVYLDGELLWIMKGKDFGGICQEKNWMIISTEFGSWGGEVVEELLPHYFYVDYVKAYAPVD